MLQRQCACGNHTIAGGECEECRKKRLLPDQAEAQLQRAPHERSASAPRRSSGASFASTRLTSPVAPRIHRATLLQRAPAARWSDSGAGGMNAKERAVGKIRRIPLEGLTEGNQEESSDAAESAKGRAIVLLHEQFDPKKPAEILLHFHGRNAGYRQTGATVRDRDVYRIEQQIEASNKPQLIGVLPQGTSLAWFGKAGSEKAFNSDAYLTEVLNALKSVGVWATAPSIGNVLLSGHSGAGELINEKLLGGAATSSLPQKSGTLREVALFDAINGPNEFNAVKDWIEKSLNLDLAQLKQQATDQDKLNYLKGSMRFRAYYSDTSNGYYTRWHVGPVKDPKAKDATPVRQFIQKWFDQHAQELGGDTSPVYAALLENYKVVSVGHKDHEQVMAQGDRLLDALKLFPKRAPGASGEQAEAPPIVHEVLGTPGQRLDQPTRAWAEAHFDHDFEHVRVHTDRQAHASAQAVHALAYTVGSNIVFGAGQYETHTPAGRALLAHELTHVVQQSQSTRSTAALKLAPAHDPLEAQAEAQSRQAEATVNEPVLQRAPDQTALKRAVCETTQNPPDAQPDECIYKFPENCPTYESWINSFARLKSFQARATPSPTRDKAGNIEGPHVFNVIGAQAAVREAQPADKGAAPPSTPLKLGEKFIDHPTDEWVKTCLPDNLRATAYQLPADCADVAIILRHVWLAAHKRTETFGKWTIGDAAGKAATARVAEIISTVGTGSVAAMVNPYTDAKGAPLVAFADLEPLLHPGDVLVWAHFDHGFDKPRTGGHTHTIAAVQRDDADHITSLSMLQGNEPIFGDRGKPGDDKGEIIKVLKVSDTDATREQLGHAPGRRIEAAQLTRGRGDFQDSEPEQDKTARKTWKWGAKTILVAAGPPKAAARPAKQKGSQVRQLTDWSTSFRSASAAIIDGTFEAMLLEARATIERGDTITDADARSVGQGAGQRLWALTKQEKDFSHQGHYAHVEELRAMIRAVQLSRIWTLKADQPQDDITRRLRKTLALIDEEFTAAARGGADITFAKGVSTKADVVKVLLTGFDPFNTSDISRKPRAGEWNPSGAAAMALDGERIPVGRGAVVAIESIVLPVDFAQFSGGLVERMIKPYAQDIDAAITVSLDPNLPAGAPVRLERYAVGVHQFANGTFEAIPAAGGGAGPAIIETNAPIDTIAGDTKQSAKGQPPVQQPTIGEDITFKFGSVAIAAQATAALGLPAATSDPVKISDRKAIQQIRSTMIRSAKGTSITFQAGNKAFQATVIEGPGGNFLSNEISFRTQRLLGEANSPKNPLSFHVHTEEGALLPPADGPGAQAQRTAAQGVRKTLIATLRRLIEATARVILGRRTTPGAGKP